MAVKERKVMIVTKDSDGNQCIDYPLTTASQVDGLAKVGQTGSYNDLTDLPDLDNIDGLPDQTDNAGKVLTTDGETASWKQPYLSLDENNDVQLIGVDGGG